MGGSSLLTRGHCHLSIVKVGNPTRKPQEYHFLCRICLSTPSRDIQAVQNTGQPQQETGRFWASGAGEEPPDKRMYKRGIQRMHHIVRSYREVCQGKSEKVCGIWSMLYSEMPRHSEVVLGVGPLPAMSDRMVIMRRPGPDAWISFG